MSPSSASIGPVEVLFGLRVVLALLAYAFLAGLFWIAYRELRALSSQARAKATAHGRIVVVECGREGGPEVGREYSLFPLTTLGRAPTNTIPVSDETASAEHARIALHGRQWWLRDLGSRNGTTVNDIRLADDIVLSSGDVVGIGRVKFRIEF